MHFLIAILPLPVPIVLPLSLLFSFFLLEIELRVYAAEEMGQGRKKVFEDSLLIDVV